MKFLDLELQYKSIKNEVDEAINRVISRSSYILGEEVDELEEKIASYCKVKYAVGLNSGSDALTASLFALGIGKGDEVIVPSFTYIATAEAVAIVGATPVFCDVNDRTFNIDPKSFESVITDKTKAVIPVHLYGQPADMDPILSLAKKHNIKVIEDAAQAIGAEYKGKKTCSMGDIGCLSFFPTKNLGAYGDGGMLLTNKKEIADWVRMWRAHGQSKKYYTDFIGASSRLDTIQAAILLAKLPHLDEWNRKRSDLAAEYNKLFATIAGIETPFVSSEVKHVYHQYTIKTNTRDLLKQKLAEVDMPTMIYYPLPLHKQKAFLPYCNTAFDLKNSEDLASEVLSLPIYPEIKIDQIEGVLIKFNDLNRI
ncbi:MAG: hypothetical protein COT25_03460 [Candidatus Kerfeldbacteria bacterium CG08_land_8_20_14_0_20_42_7]|uniref:Transcriptional regulator n=1 Tax=Candidatus Kerfeldbacteria bacterium CG08_land_8_20_14_0_20_42_7 TaxID=2014245 RepID=A0A2H0YSA7_9BACT|nr:MAG: hypothetical protein COT25_03460 [Candidatus Kerfeldbacteria bacterium CG08_land_8_20_14_0_20_42_7]